MNFLKAASSETMVKQYRNFFCNCGNTVATIAPFTLHARGITLEAVRL